MISPSLVVLMLVGAFLESPDLRNTVILHDSYDVVISAKRTNKESLRFLLKYSPWNKSPSVWVYVSHPFHRECTCMTNLPFTCSKWYKQEDGSKECYNTTKDAHSSLFQSYKFVSSDGLPKSIDFSFTTKVTYPNPPSYVYENESNLKITFSSFIVNSIPPDPLLFTPCYTDTPCQPFDFKNILYY